MTTTASSLRRSRFNAAAKAGAEAAAATLAMSAGALSVNSTSDPSASVTRSSSRCASRKGAYSASEPICSQPHLHISRRLWSILCHLAGDNAETASSASSGVQTAETFVRTRCRAGVSLEAASLSSGCGIVWLSRRETQLFCYGDAAPELVRRMHLQEASVMTERKVGEDGGSVKNYINPSSLLHRQAIHALVAAARGSALDSPNPSASLLRLHCASATASSSTISLSASTSLAVGFEGEECEGESSSCCLCFGSRPRAFCRCSCHAPPLWRLRCTDTPTGSDSPSCFGCSKGEEAESTRSLDRFLETPSVTASPRFLSRSTSRLDAAESPLVSSSNGQSGSLGCCVGSGNTNRSFCVCSLARGRRSSQALHSRHPEGDELMYEMSLLQQLFLCLDTDGDGLLAYEDFADGLFELLLLAVVKRQAEADFEALAEGRTGACVSEELGKGGIDCHCNLCEESRQVYRQLLEVAKNADVGRHSAMSVSDFLAMTVSPKLLIAQKALRR